MLERLLKSWTLFALKHPAKLMVLFPALFALGLFGASRLGISTNLNLLLPQDSPSVVTAKNAAGRVGSTDFLIVGIEGPDPLQNKAIADRMVELMRERMPDLAEVSARVDLDFFKRNALLYFDLSRLSMLNEQLRTVVGRSRLQSMGLLVLPEGRDPEEKKLEDILQEGRPQERIPGEFRRTGSTAPAELAGYFASPDGTILAVMARPNMLSIDMATARSLVYRTESLIAEVLDGFPDPKPRVEVGGGYRNRVVEYDSILSDIRNSFLVSFLLIAVLIIVFFRSLRPLPLIFFPLLLGIILTLAFTRGMGFEKLNIITAFIGGILLGMGIDFGVHLTSRYFHERSGAALQEALVATMQGCGRALVTAGATTSGALFLLFISRFRGFWEFGLIAGMGVLVTMVVFFLFFPVFALLQEKILPLKARVPWTWPFKPQTPTAGFPVKSLAVLVVFLLVSVAFLPWGLSRLEFETNLRRLSGNPSTTVQYGKAMGDRASPTVMLCDNAKDCKHLTDHFSDLLNRPLPHPEIRDMMSIHTFLPENQEEKLVLLAQIRKQLEDARGWADESLEKRIERYLEYVPQTPLTMDNLPDWLRLRFTEANGEVGRFLYIYPARETWNAHEAAQLKMAIAQVDLEPMGGQPGSRAQAASSSFILVEILDMVRKEGYFIIPAALLLVFLLLLLDFRSPLSALVVTLPLLAALLWIAGLMPLLGQRLGLYNMVVISTIIGTGIDASVHLFHAARENPDDPRPAFFRTGLAVGMAALTTMVGFAGMMWVGHGGLSSIGRLATIGISATLLCAVILVPAGVFLLRRTRSGKGAA